VVQREGEMLQSSISTLSSHSRVIGDGFTGYCCLLRVVKRQMRVTKIERSGEQVQERDWSASNKSPSSSAEPPNYTADALGAGYSHVYINSITPQAVATRCGVVSIDSVSRGNHMQCAARPGQGKPPTSLSLAFASLSPQLSCFT
jgi:hypothetical protein